MAFIQSSRKKSGGHIDLTPMVDLNFLLITFFMLTTSLAEPKAMDLQMPYKPSDDPNIFHEASAMTLIPSADHKVYYYEGLPQQPLHYEVAYLTGNNSLRDVLSRKQKELHDAGMPAIQVIIKPDTTATFDDLIQVLDEMKILKIRCYAITDIAPAEAVVLKVQAEN